MKRIKLYTLTLGAVCAFVFAPFSVAAQEDASGGGSEDEVIRLSPFQVDTTQDIGYGGTHSLGAARINIPIREIPSYTVTINEQFMKDVAALELNDATRFVSGMELASSGRNGQTTLRGYEIGTANWRDGLPENLAFGGVVFTDMGDTAQVEIIKGPTGVLYGSHSMGGLVNRVSKTPLDEQQTLFELNVGAGSEKFIRGMVDTTGPIGDRGTSFRAIATWRDGEFDFGGVDRRRAFTGILSQTFGDRDEHRAWIRAQIIDNDVNDDQFSWFVDMNQEISSGLMPTDFNYAPVHDAHKFNWIDNIEAGTEFSLDGPGSSWNLRVMGRYSDFDGDKRASYFPSNIFAMDAQGNEIGNRLQVSWRDPNIANWEVSLLRRNFFGGRTDKGVYADLHGEFDLGPTQNNLIVTGSWSETDTFRYWDTTTLPRFDLFNQPDWRTFNFAANEFNPVRSSDTASEGRGTDIGFQNNMAMFDRRLIVVGGARYDSGKSTGRNNLTGVTSSASNSEWTYKAGVIGEVTDGFHLFAQRATTFQFVNAVDEQGRPFPNRDGYINEGGVKLELAEHGLVATASYFDMSLTNVLVSVPATDEFGNVIGGTVQRPVGSQDTKGYEIDLAWQPIRGLDLFAAFGNIDSKDEQGRSFRSVGQGNNYKFFGRYEFQEGQARGLFFGLGYNYVNERAGDAGNTFFLPSYDVWEGLVGYNTERWRLQMNVYNMFDSTYARASVNSLFIVPGPQRTFRISFNYRM